MEPMGTPLLATPKAKQRLLKSSFEEAGVHAQQTPKSGRSEAWMGIAAIYSSKSPALRSLCRLPGLPYTL